MAKVFTLLQRKSGWSRSDFSDYWGSTHKEHALDLARAGFFSGYVQNHLISESQSPAWPAADGIPEIWVPSIESLAEIAASDIYQQGAAPDEKNFTTGEVASYISGAGAELGLPLLSSPVPKIRHLLFLKVDYPEQMVQIMDCHGMASRADATDTFIATSAIDGKTQCLVISGFWNAIELAREALDEMSERLLKLTYVQPLNAGLYEARTVVNPKTGKWG